MSEIDERVIEYGLRYLSRRFPLLQIEKEQNVRNAVSDLMFLGKFMVPIEDQPNANT